MVRTHRITLELRESLYDDMPSLDALTIKHELESIIDLYWPVDELTVLSVDEVK